MPRTLAARVFCMLLLTKIPAIPTYAGQVVTTEEERDQRAAELKRYRAVIEAYRGGDRTAVKTILAWDTKRLDAIVTTIGTAHDPIRAWTATQLKAAAMLHTDAAIERLYEDESQVGFQLDLGGRLLQKAGPEVVAFSRDWYSAVARTLRSVALFTVAERFLEDGRKRQPNDSLLLFESGVLQEHIATFAAFLVQVEGPSAPTPRPGGPFQSHAAAETRGGHPSVPEQRRALNNSAGWLRESLALDAENELTQLHLGRVQMLRGDRDASKTLERLARSSTDSSTAYLATMFLAAMDARNDRHASAENRYRAAAEKLPLAHSAYVALSETLQKLGRGDESREVLRGLLARPPDSGTEPWWWYLSDPGNELRSRLAALRAAVRQ
jgi:tetratricopeptide (TPR) repeat protein